MRVLLVIARDPTARLRDIAAALEITERATQRIVTELVEDGYLTRKREGRRNTYKLHPKRGLRAAQAPRTQVGDLLEVLLENQDPLDRSI